jgi:hypothetical protein
VQSRTVSNPRSDYHYTWFSPWGVILFGVSIGSSLLATFCWSPVKISILNGAWSRCSLLVTSVAAAFGSWQGVLISILSSCVPVVATGGSEAEGTSRRDCGAGPFLAAVLIVILSTTRWPFLHYMPSVGVLSCLFYHTVCIGPNRLAWWRTGARWSGLYHVPRCTI